jgi:hypothetical protein
MVARKWIKYLPNRVGDWKAQNHKDFNQPNQICTNGQAMSRTECLWDNLQKPQHKDDYTVELTKTQNIYSVKMIIVPLLMCYALCFTSHKNVMDTHNQLLKTWFKICALLRRRCGSCSHMQAQIWTTNQAAHCSKFSGRMRECITTYLPKGEYKCDWQDYSHHLIEHSIQEDW